MNSCGILNVDKPSGLTSRDVVNRIVPLVHPAKVGHAGTLDPLATGVLVVCVGHATRLVDLIQMGRKRYLAKFELGLRSDTDDATGQITKSDGWETISAGLLTESLSRFVGRIQQVPPQFSAVHVGGRRAYELARRGEVVGLSARSVNVFSIQLKSFDPPEFETVIECSSGTYIRSIGRDVGQLLGCGAVMTQLQRLSVGPFAISEAVKLEMLNRETIHQYLQPALVAANHLKQCHLSDAETASVRCGQSLEILARFDDSYHPVCDAPGNSELYDRRVALVGQDGQLIGIAEIDTEVMRLCPKIVFPAARSF